VEAGARREYLQAIYPRYHAADPGLVDRRGLAGAWSSSVTAIQRCGGWPTIAP
jgi:hypothetical protein